MFDISLEIRYCINHETVPKTVVCKITVGLPVGNPDQSYALNSLLFDNETVFLGETLDKKWGRYDSSKSHFRRYTTLEYNCEYSIDDYGNVTITPPSLSNIINELTQLQWVVQRNIVLKQALPAKKEFTLPISEDGKVDLSALC